MLSITGLPFIPIHVILCQLESKWSCRLFFAKVQQVPGKGSGSMGTWKAMCWIHAIAASCDASSSPIITLYYIQFSCVQSLRLLSLKVLQMTVNFFRSWFRQVKSWAEIFLKLERRRFLVFWVLFLWGQPRDLQQKATRTKRKNIPRNVSSKWCSCCRIPVHLLKLVHRT